MDDEEKKTNLQKLIDNEIECIEKEGISINNLETLYKLVDIKKDLENIDYWKTKKEVMEMRYSDYDEYSDGGYGRGRYGRDSYGRRGVSGTGRGRSRYGHGDEYIERMRDRYMDYADGRDSYGRGDYGAKEDMVQSVEEIMKNMYKIVEELSSSATEAPEVTQIIKEYARKMSEM